MLSSTDDNERAVVWIGQNCIAGRRPVPLPLDARRQTQMPRSANLTADLVAILVLSSGGTARSAEPGPPSDAGSADDATALAKKLQNPIGDLYSFPFQDNTNFNTGPNKGTQDILNIQPVIPIHINEDWNVITRTILPLIWQPSFQPAQTVPFGTGPTRDMGES
jgi:hypothetical protein